MVTQVALTGKTASAFVNSFSIRQQNPESETKFLKGNTEQSHSKSKATHIYRALYKNYLNHQKMTLPEIKEEVLRTASIRKLQIEKLRNLPAEVRLELNRDVNSAFEMIAETETKEDFLDLEAKALFDFHTIHELNDNGDNSFEVQLYSHEDQTTKPGSKILTSLAPAFRFLLAPLIYPILILLEIFSFGG